MAKLKNISNINQIIRWTIGSDIPDEVHTVEPNEIVENVPDNVAMSVLIGTSNIWEPADTYTKRLMKLSSTKKGKGTSTHPFDSISVSIGGKKEVSVGYSILPKNISSEYVPCQLAPKILGDSGQLTELKTVNISNDYEPCRLIDTSKIKTNDKINYNN